MSVGVAALPDGVGFAEGAALGLAGTTAATAVAAAELGPGSVVLISGATGGVGNQAVQLAAATGAHVIGTGRTEQGRALVAELGADEVIDYAAGLNRRRTRVPSRRGRRGPAFRRRRCRCCSRW